jgi:hypothetical protein
MEDFLPDGTLKYISAVSYKREKAPISEKLQKEILTYMQDSKDVRMILLIPGENNKLMTDNTYAWFTKMLDDVKEGRCQFKDEFVKHVLSVKQNTGVENERKF